MKRLAFAIAFAALCAASAFGQSATLATPEQPPSRTNLVVGSVCVQRDLNNAPSASVDLWVMAADGSKTDTITVQMVGSEAVGLITAEMTAIPGETGGNARKMNARILKYLHDNCATFATPCVAKVGTTTLVP